MAVPPTRPTAPPTFDDAYNDHAEFVFRTVRRLGVADRHADDATQDVFVIVHRKLGEFRSDDGAPLRAWLFGIARRVAKDYRRRAQRKERDLPITVPVAARGVSPHDAAVHAEATATLHRLLSELGDAQREVFILAELEQMTAPEIATATETKLNTVYSRLRLARATFNEALTALRERESVENTPVPVGIRS